MSSKLIWANWDIGNKHENDLLPSKVLGDDLKQEHAKDLHSGKNHHIRLLLGNICGKANKTLGFLKSNRNMSPR